MPGRIQILDQPEKHNVTFEKRQWKELEKIARRERRSIHEIIRQAVDANLPKRDSTEAGAQS
jgi:hypothetical protein